jgi:four helix bundle protein
MKKSFRDLLVWKKSIELSKKIYELTEKSPEKEKFGITNQIRRSAVSIASNIAEGSGRYSDKEFAQFLSIARGSVAELYTQLAIAVEVGYFDKKSFETIEISINEVGKMINGLRNSITND